MEERDQGGIDAGYMIRCGGNGVINFNLGTGTWQEINSAANSVLLNNWHHVAATYDGTNMKIYVDGIVIAEANRLGLIIANNVSKNLFIGKSPGFPGGVFNGKIDEVRIWDIARTQSQIQSTMNTILTSEYYSSPDSGLVGYWRLDEGAGQTSEDLSYFANSATLGNSLNPDPGDPQWIESNILIVEVENENGKNFVPEYFALMQNYPNPFNPSTKIKYTIPSVESRHASSLQMISLKVYDILGNEIATLVNEEKPAGTYEVEFSVGQDCRPDIASGIYFYRLRAGSFSKTKKMLLLK
jgi:hypothetical protein